MSRVAGPRCSASEIPSDARLAKTKPRYADTRGASGRPFALLSNEA